MKKINTVLFVLFSCFITMNAKAQLTGTKWKGVANVPMPIQCLFNFKIDTVLLQYAGNEPINLPDQDGNMVSATGKDSMVIETMTYKVSGNTLTLQKVTGSSPCSDEIGKYRIAINDNKLLITLIEDDCEARVHAWPADPLIAALKLN